MEGTNSAALWFSDFGLFESEGVFASAVLMMKDLSEGSWREMRLKKDAQMAAVLIRCTQS